MNISNKGMVMMLYLNKKNSDIIIAAFQGDINEIKTLHKQGALVKQNAFKIISDLLNFITKVQLDDPVSAEFYHTANDLKSTLNS